MNTTATATSLSSSAAPAALPVPTQPSWLDPQLYPFAPQVHRSADGPMHYVDVGEGRPILFVHGTPSWSFEWRHCIAGLHHEFRCIAPDQLGFGRSAKPRDIGYAPADHARRLVDFVDALDLRDLTLVVHDFGGPIGLPVALRRPERVRAVVVINTWMWAHGERRDVRRLSRLVASPLGRFFYLRLNASPRWLLPATFVDRSKLTCDVHRHYLAPFGRASERVGAWTLGRELAGSDPFYAGLWAQRARLAERPLSLVWGMQDIAFGEDYLERWREAFPEASVTRIEAAGHFPQEEQPETVTAAIHAAASR